MWENPLKILPFDSEEVYIRVGTNYGNPFKATYNATTQIFTSVESGMNVPAYMVARWKY